VRFILILIAIMAGYLLLRSLLAPIVQAVVAVLTASQPPPKETAQAPLPHTGELKKDPVCGTFVAAELAVQGKFKGEIVHFCSAKCRDEYARRA
jgi:YHS domain-containing protein